MFFVDLSYGVNGTGWAGVNYAWPANNTQQMKAHESGILLYTAAATFTGGEVLRVAREGSDIVYYIDGVEKYRTTESGANAGQPLMVDFTMSDLDGVIYKLKMSETKQGVHLLSIADYYPFGSLIPQRRYNPTEYRYGFNGMEKDDEVKGTGNSLDFGARIYDPRLGRFISVDPEAAKAPGWSTYRAFFDNPILFVDPDGNFEIPKYLEAKYPDLKPALQNIVAELQKPENADKLNTILKLGEFADANQLISLFDDNNKTIKLGEANMLFPNVQKTGLVGDQGSTLTSRRERDAGSGMLKSTITLDDDLYRLIGEQGLSKEASDFALKLFESTLIHEIVHSGDNQDGVMNSSEPVQLTTDSQGKLNGTTFNNKEVGKYAEKEIYGEDVQASDNDEVKKNIIANDK